MDDRTIVALADLPKFTITAVTPKGQHMLLTGVLDHLEGVKVGRAWLYKPNNGSLEGDLISVDADTRAARVLVAGEELPAEFQPGASFPYFYGYFETSVVDMILDVHRIWTRVRYEPTDSLRIVGDSPDELLYGEIEVGTPIPSGFRIVEMIPKGWSKESCELCQAKIGPAYQPFGYRDERDVAAGLNSRGYWLCERDYEKFASRHDLSFLIS